MATAPSQQRSSKSKKNRKKAAPLPVMKVTRYDRVSSFMIALVLGMILVVSVIIAYYLEIRKSDTIELIPIEMIDMGGGDPDGQPDETLHVESPEDINPNASPVDEAIEEEELTETLENVVELADRATKQVERVTANTDASGTPGSAVGTGARPLGEGPGSGGGVSPWVRWVIRFNESSTTEYAKQLNHFGIELAVYNPASNKLTYLSGKTTNGFKDERIYFQWAGGARERIDRQLFQQKGINTSGGKIYHFYPNKTVQLLATVERDYRNRNAKEIRRTYYSVVKQGSGYTFLVTKQTYL